MSGLSNDRGHRTLVILGKGNRKAKVVITPGTSVALDDYLADRAQQAGVDLGALAGPLVATRTGGRLPQGNLWELIRRLAKAADIAS